MAMGARSLGLLAGFGGGNSVNVARDRRRNLGGNWPRAESLPASAAREDFHASSCLIQNHTVHLEADHRPDRIEELKQGARKALSNGQDLNLVDTLQHLGIGYHFEEEIDVLLRRSYADTNRDEDDLFRTALRFKLLRQGGYDITQDVFRKFVDREGVFKEDLRKDTFGLLSLHEASYLGATGEEVLSQAKMFSKQQLLHKLKSAVLEPSIARELGLVLDFPRQRMMERLEAKAYIEKLHHNQYCRSTNSDLLELATLDYNHVQRLYQSEIRELESWWRNIGLAKKLSFARDRPLECFLWTVGMFPEPCFSMCRLGVAKAVAILLVIDDIYDIYGTPEELVLFTDAIRRWDVDAMEMLPEYMKIGYMAIYNTTNEIALKVLTEHGLYAIPQLRKTWVDICEAFLLESNWFRSEEEAEAAAPSLDDYIRNGITTAGTYMALVHAFFLMGKQVTKESLGVIDSCPELFTNSGRILRLWDDLGTSKAEQERGDNASSISCYRRNNRSSSEDDARRHVRILVDNSWQDLMKESLSVTTLPNSIIKATMNLARTSQAIYQHGDNDKAPSVDDCIEYLLKKPICHSYSTKSSNVVASTLGLCSPKNHNKFIYI